MNNGEIFPGLPRIRASAYSSQRRDLILGTVLWLGFLALLFLR